MTALKEIILRQIAVDGPMSLASFMQTCLLHPEHGYYATRDPLGQAGDFTTAPEISQMFGELLGLSLAQAWIDQGKPSAYLCELGPGRGTLMADIMRATAKIHGFPTKIYLVEASPHLREIQAKTLAGLDVSWVDELADLPNGPMFLVANEFFDALPIRQFQRGEAGWCERRVGASDGTLTLGLAGDAPVDALSHRLEDTKPGDIVETCPAAFPIMTQIATRLTDGGAAIIVDYGDWRSLGDTFQALQNHAVTDPFAAPGQADLTAHVDFEALAQAASPLDHSLLVTQGVLLERLGITQRAQTLAKNSAESDLDGLITAHRRLTHPDEMGTLFKALALVRPGAALPPGFERRSTQ